MKERIKIIINYLVKSVNVDYVKNIIVIIFVISILYLIGKGDVDIKGLFISVVIIIILLIYKWLLGLLVTESMIQLIRSKKKNGLTLIFLYMDDYLLKKNKWLIRPIYLILYYFPTNGFFLFVIYLGKKFGNIRLLINSNKDIVGKKYFGKDGSKMRSPLSNNKYLIWYRKYIFDVFMMILFIPLYFKIKLMVIEWDKYFKYRLFGVVYSTVLVVNNIHPTVGLRTTESITVVKKAIICVIALYIVLYFFKLIIGLRAGRQVEGFKKIEGDKEYEYTQKDSLLWLKLDNIFSEISIAEYYLVKDFLLFICLAEKYGNYIDKQYSGYISKGVKGKSLHMAKDLVKMGKFNDKGEKILNYYEEALPELFKEEKLYNIDMVGIYEKNYRVSFFFSQYLFYYKYYLGLVHYTQQLLDYELYKTFYGVEVVEKYFKEGMEETKSMSFIYEFWYKGVVEDNKMHEKMKKIARNEINDIPSDIKYKTNREYNEILELGGEFFMHKYNHIDYEMGYKRNFKKEVSMHVEAIRSDIESFREYYDNDLEKFIYFGTVSPNQWPKDDPIMRLRIEVFSKHMPVFEKAGMEVGNQVNELYNKAKEQNRVIEQIKMLQEEHKRKYFLKKPRETKGKEFLLKYKMLEEGRWYEEVNREQFIVVGENNTKEDEKKDK